MESSSVSESTESLFLMYAVLMRTKGAETTASDVHDAWSAWMSGVDPPPQMALACVGGHHRAGLVPGEHAGL
ncbi:DUF7701 domain-containing protein [Brevibacterium daeguense]|uniref:DUF7701 domain-containing protein n=1 Tax=Brevibacterium daeguense TaxID=909936 RepID=UPI003CD07E37